MNNLKEKSIQYQIGYWFFLLIGIVGVSKQMIDYINGNLTLVSEEYWFNPELILTGLFMLFIFRPMGLVEIIETIFKGLSNRFFNK